MSSTRPRVLVVDDSPVIRAVVVGMIEHLGAECDWAANGRDAITAAGRTRYDLVLLDLRMPGLDGPNTARQILGSPGAGPPPRIVGVTGDPSEAGREACLRAGMSAMLVKPLRLADLSKLLEAAAVP